MNDVLSTLAVIGIAAVWAFFAFTWSVMHMDIGPTLSWWVGQVILLLIAALGIYAVIHWAVMT